MLLSSGLCYIWRRLLLLAGILLSAAISPALSQTSLKLGYTPTSEFLASYVAAEEGFFKARGLDVELVLIPLNSNIPSALQAGSIQFGGPTTTTLLQATDGGLSLAVVAGGSMMTKISTNFSVVGRNSANLKKASDFEGKRVGVPGIGAIMQVIFRKWLMVNGVDPRKVIYVEAGFPQLPDLIRGGTVDAVLSIEPITSRVLQTGEGTIVTRMVADLPDDLMLFVYASRQSFAKENPEIVSKFRDALIEAKAFAEKNPDKAREAISKYTKLPPEAVKNVQMPQLRIESAAKDLTDWIKMMDEQKMLKGKIDGASLYVR